MKVIRVPKKRIFPVCIREYHSMLADIRGRDVDLFIKIVYNEIEQ